MIPKDHWSIHYNSGVNAGISFAVDRFLQNIIPVLQPSIADNIRETTINYLIKEFNGET